MLKLYAKENKRRSRRFLLVTDGEPKTPTSKGVVVDVGNKTLQRVRDLPTFMRLCSWKPLDAGDPTLDQLVKLVQALRPYRGIEVCLPGGETAWICWRQWTSESRAAQENLTRTTYGLAVPAYELDGDYFLATQAVALLGGNVLDPPRSSVSLSDDVY